MPPHTPPNDAGAPSILAPAVVRVWDLPTRLFHVVLAVCVIGSIITGLYGGSAMVWHFRLGYCVATLLVFRLIWGFMGGYWSRFGSFMFTPPKLLAYLKGKSPLAHRVGHNPLGALSVFALLGMLLVQVSTGLTSDDEIANVGPWAKLVSGAWVSTATAWHKGLGFKLVIALLVLHLAAIAFYTWYKKEPLVSAMVSGDKLLSAADADRLPASSDSVKHRLLALGVFAACIAAVWLGVVRLA